LSGVQVQTNWRSMHLATGYPARKSCIWEGDVRNGLVFERRDQGRHQSDVMWYMGGGTTSNFLVKRGPGSPGRFASKNPTQGGVYSLAGTGPLLFNANLGQEHETPIWWPGSQNDGVLVRAWWRKKNAQQAGASGWRGAPEEAPGKKPLNRSPPETDSH